MMHAPYRCFLGVCLDVAAHDRDFLRRGAAVYADRPAVFEQPGTQGSLGTVSYWQRS
jgi:hypothetical protein